MTKEKVYCCSCKHYIDTTDSYADSCHKVMGYRDTPTSKVKLYGDNITINANKNNDCKYFCRRKPCWSTRLLQRLGLKKRGKKK